MSWVQKISHYSSYQKEGLYRFLIPPSLYRAFGINPLDLSDEKGHRLVSFFCPEGDSTCLVEIKLPEIKDPVYSIQISDAIDQISIEWDFLHINDPLSERFNTDIDEDSKDTLFGWASKNKEEEKKACRAGYFPGQTRKGLRLTGQAVKAFDLFCRILGIKIIRMEALFYHNAITHERYGFSYLEGYRQMKRIHELFQPGEILYKKMDNSSPFRQRDQAHTVRGRSWAIHDNILDEVEDDILEDGWVSPVMYRMVEKPRGMVTFPEPVYS